MEVCNKPVLKRLDSLGCYDLDLQCSHVSMFTDALISPSAFLEGSVWAGLSASPRRRRPVPGTRLAPMAAQVL